MLPSVMGGPGCLLSWLARGLYDFGVEIGETSHQIAFELQSKVGSDQSGPGRVRRRYLRSYSEPGTNAKAARWHSTEKSAFPRKKHA